MLGSIMRHYGINPTEPDHSEKHAALRARFKEIKFVPIMPQKELKNPALLKYYPQPGAKAGQRMKPEPLAQLAVGFGSKPCAPVPPPIGNTSANRALVQSEDVRLRRTPSRCPNRRID